MKSHPRNTDIFSTILFSINRSLSLPFSLSHSNNNTCAHAQFLLGLSPFKRFHPFRFRGRQLRSHPWLFPLFCSREHPLTKPTGLTMKKNLCPFLSMHLPHPDPNTISHWHGCLGPHNSCLPPRSPFCNLLPTQLAASYFFLTSPFIIISWPCSPGFCLSW